MTRRVRGAASVLLAVVLVSSSAACVQPGGIGSPPHGSGDSRLRPVIFVHGGSGSGAQFESQAMRLTSNGYPARLVAVHEYDSTFGINTMEEVWAGLDELIAELLEASRADQVDLLGHSLGTAVSQGYLTSSPERAEQVAHYVNIDGAPATAPPAGVDTLAVWGEGNQDGEITGAENHYAPDQAHVQVATSAETFEQFYEFFTGRPPRTTDVVPERANRIRLSGEANLFPSNQGADGATLEIWQVDGETGARQGRRPSATYEIGEDGAWGPFRAKGNTHYEFALTRLDQEGEETTHHFYFQPFFRSNHLIRLLTSEPGTGIDVLREQSDRHTTLNIVRYKEIWGDQGELDDVLEVEGESVINEAIAPRSARLNALFVMDDGSDGMSNLDAPIADLAGLPFISGTDLFLPAADPPDDPVRVEMVARAGDGEPEVVNVPNWISSEHHVSVQFRDFEQDVERSPGRGRGHGHRR